MELTDTEALVACTVLEDMLAKLDVMKHMLPELRLNEGEAPEPSFEAGLNHLSNIKNSPKKPPVCVDEQPTSGEEVRDAETGELAAEEIQPPTVEDFPKPDLRSLPSNEMEKAQLDRAFLSKVLRASLEEILEYRTFNVLKTSIAEEFEQKHALQKILQFEADSAERIEELKRGLARVKETRRREVGRRKKKLAYLRNEYQELKAKTRMEDSFLLKSTVTEVDWKKKRCAYDENNLRGDIKKLEDEMEEETRNNVEMETFIGLHQAEMEQRVEMWMDKYDKDFDAKNKELETLKKMLAADKERLEMLTVLYAEYEATIVDDRIMREKERRRIEKERRENEATLRIQSWWRGVIIRKGMKLFKPPKPKKKKGRRK